MALPLPPVPPSVTLRAAARGVVRHVLEPLLSLGDLDLHAARWRLDALRARHAELSAIVSVDDSPGGPSDRLLDVAAALLPRARSARLRLLAERGAPGFVHVWPGEHYRLLAAMVEECAPRTVLDIGTYTGLSALAMLAALGQDGRVVTVDVGPWRGVPGSFLREADFEDGRLTQLVADLGDPAVAATHAGLLRAADLILVDAAKDGVLERNLLANFATAGMKPGALIVFDDIRLWNMLPVWREIAWPKLDLTSFGHWSGTGLVDASPADGC